MEQLTLAMDLGSLSSVHTIIDRAYLHLGSDEQSRNANEL